MEMIIKVLVRLALIPVFIWIIQLIIAFIQGIREGMQEDKEERRQEELKKLEEQQKLKKEEDEMIQALEEQVPLMERAAIALACPFRAIEISSKGKVDSPHLWKLGCLDDEEKSSLKMVLSRDFELIFDEEDTDSIGVQMMRCLSRIEESGWGVVMATSIYLHLITACVDLGYIQFEEYRNLIAYYMKELRKCNLQSWKEYAEQFLKDEKEGKMYKSLVRIVIKYQTGRLLEKEDSPWVNLPWESLMELDLEKKFILLENPKEYLTDWHKATGSMVSDKISVDGCRVGGMYRENPLDEDFSGWSFWGENESDEYWVNWANYEIFDLNTVCNYDPDIVPYLGAPFGSGFRRDKSGKFQKVDFWEEMREEM